jgi:structural maintenance of chromosome 3 (chondroitin sulfate proteoglycan 6)
VKTKLRTYSDVNKKAIDQYINFTEQREQLLVRKDELDKGAEAIRELIEVLDYRKCVPMSQPGLP